MESNRTAVTSARTDAQTNYTIPFTVFREAWEKKQNKKLYVEKGKKKKKTHSKYLTHFKTYHG